MCFLFSFLCSPVELPFSHRTLVLVEADRGFNEILIVEQKVQQKRSISKCVVSLIGLEQTYDTF